MPFESDKQRKFMFARHPGIARRWVDEAHEEGVSPTKHKKKRKKLRLRRRAKVEQMEKSMDLVDIRKAAFGPAAFRAANTAPLHRTASTTMSVGRPYTPNPFTMAAMEGLARRRAAKQLRAVKKSWQPINKAGGFSQARRAIFGANKAERAASAAAHQKMVANLPKVSSPTPTVLPDYRPNRPRLVPMAERRARAAKKWDAQAQAALPQIEAQHGARDYQRYMAQNPWR
jgi:hypothetical protein